MPRTKRLFADLTAIALPLAIMDGNGALSPFASCRTRQVRAKLVGRVHRLCVCLHKRQHAYGRSLFQVLLTFSPVRVALPQE
jgi:hypothetical protein